MALQKGVAQTIGIICYDGETPTAPADLAAEVSTDEGAFGAADNAPTSVGDGLVTLLLSATEMDGDVITVKLTSSNLEDQMAVYLTEADWTATEAGRIDATVSSRSTLTAAQVWAYGTRTLTTFGTLVADTAAAVWAAVTRTLTAFDFEVETEVDADALADALIAAGVASETFISRLLARRISIADFDISLTAGGQLVDDDGAISVVRDDDTTIAVVWEDQDITDYVIYMTVRPTRTSTDTDDTGATFQIIATITDAAAGEFEFTIGHEQTAECDLAPERTYWYDMQAITSDGAIKTLIIGQFSVLGDVTRRRT